MKANRRLFSTWSYNLKSIIGFTITNFKVMNLTGFWALHELDTYVILMELSLTIRNTIMSLLFFFLPHVFMKAIYDVLRWNLLFKNITNGRYLLVVKVFYFTKLGILSSLLFFSLLNVFPPVRWTIDHHTPIRWIRRNDRNDRNNTVIE